MIEFLLAIGMMIFIISIVLLFTLWAFHQHYMARKWRRLSIELAKQRTITTVGNGRSGWEVTYKGKGNKVETEVISSNSESEAILVLFKRGISPKGIIGTRKV